MPPISYAYPCSTWSDGTGPIRQIASTSVVLHTLVRGRMCRRQPAINVYIELQTKHSAHPNRLQTVYSTSVNRILVHHGETTDSPNWRNWNKSRPSYFQPLTDNYTPSRRFFMICRNGIVAKRVVSDFMASHQTSRLQKIFWRGNTSTMLKGNCHGAGFKARTGPQTNTGRLCSDKVIFKADL